MIANHIVEDVWPQWRFMTKMAQKQVRFLKNLELKTNPVICDVAWNNRKEKLEVKIRKRPEKKS